MHHDASSTCTRMCTCTCTPCRRLSYYGYTCYGDGEYGYISQARHAKDEPLALMRHNSHNSTHNASLFAPHPYVPWWVHDEARSPPSAPPPQSHTLSLTLSRLVPTPPSCLARALVRTRLGTGATT